MKKLDATCTILSSIITSIGKWIFVKSYKILSLIYFQIHSIDATAETGKLGRLVNHSRNGNLLTKVITVNNRPHLILIAKDNIPIGTELTYDYGDRSKEALLHHPWLAL